MSTLRNAVILLGLGMGASASADHVDWSQFIEAPGAKAPMAKHAEAPVVTAAKKQAPAAKPAKVAAKVAAKPAVKTRAKPAARKAHR